MWHFDEFIKDFNQLVFDKVYIVFVKYFTIFLVDLNNQESILKFIIYRILSFLSNDIFELANGFVTKCFQKLFVFLNWVVNEFSHNVGEQGCIGLTELFDVKLVAWEWLDFFVVYLWNFFAEILSEQTLGSWNDLGLIRKEFVDGGSLIAFLWQD